MQLRFIRLGVSVTAVLFGLSIVGVSLLTAGSVESTDGERMSERTLYVSQEILPDNVLYPVLMVADRVQLEMADDHEQLYMRMQYADRRLEYARELIKRGNTEVAVATLTKAQKYLLDVAHAVLEHQLQGAVRSRVQEELAFQAKEIAALAPSFNDEQNAVLSALVAQSTVLQQQLAN